MTTPLDDVLGSEGVVIYLNDLIRELMYHDHLDKHAAKRVACERAVDASPWMIAVAGQIWTLRNEFRPTDYWHHRIRILQRAHAVNTEDGGNPDQVQIADVTDTEDSIEPVNWFDVEDLASYYRLTHWPDRPDFAAPVDAAEEADRQ